MNGLIEVYGTYGEIGYKIGKMFSNKIKKLIADRYSTILVEFENSGMKFNKEAYNKISVKLIDSLRNYTPNEFEELCGICEGARVSLNDVIFALGYSDIFDILSRNAISRRTDEEGCTSFIASGKCNRNAKTFGGQTWDMPPGSEEYTALFHKNLNDGSDFYSYTTVLGLTHMGMNNNGICIGTTNVSTKDTGEGVIFCALIQSALTKQTVEQSLNVFKNIPRASGHYYYLIGPNDIGYSIELSASDFEIHMIRDEIYVHANHYKNNKFLRDAIDYSPTSKQREEYMKRFLKYKSEDLEIKYFKEILSNHEGNICRHITKSKGENIPSITCGAVVFEPDEKRIYIGQGYPCEGRWEEFPIRAGR
jgi:isopenicillin-N N-acyltransferase-like protein